MKNTLDIMKGQRTMLYALNNFLLNLELLQEIITALPQLTVLLIDKMLNIFLLQEVWRKSQNWTQPWFRPFTISLCRLTATFINLVF